MMVSQLVRLHAQMARPRVTKSRERLEGRPQEAADKEPFYVDFLDQLLTEEIHSKTAKNIATRTNLAHSPFVNSLESFNFAYQPRLGKSRCSIWPAATSPRTARRFQWIRSLELSSNLGRGCGSPETRGYKTGPAGSDQLA